MVIVVMCCCSLAIVLLLCKDSRFLCEKRVGIPVDVSVKRRTTGRTVEFGQLHTGLDLERCRCQPVVLVVT